LRVAGRIVDTRTGKPTQVFGAFLRDAGFSALAENQIGVSIVCWQQLRFITR